MEYANKAYLKESNGIKEIEAVRNGDTTIYSINGIAMSSSIDSLPKGIYIQGGMKFIK